MTGPADARSLLFVPGDRPERFIKAAESGADCIIIDLEDAVAPGAKELALASALAWLAEGGQAMVRINACSTPWHAAELAALVDTPAWVMLPKAQSPAEISAVRDSVGDRIVALVETAAGVRDVDLIAGAPGVSRLALGNVDLSTDLGVDPRSHTALAYARGRLVVASAAAGIDAPIDGVTTSLDSPDILADDLEATRTLGFTGKLCIHPRQVQAVNAALAPTVGELSWARRILDAASDVGVSVVDGLMVDPPVLARARCLVARQRH